MNYFLGIDIGTTGTKTILFDELGNSLGRGYKGYELITPYEKFYEQNAEDWYDAVVESTLVAVKNFSGKISGVSFSAQGGSFLLCDIDEKGELIPLTNAITWLDNRAEREFVKYSKKIEEITGSKYVVGSAIYRLLWIKDNQPDLYKKAKVILSTSDYVYYKLTKRLVVDYTSAAMMDLTDQSDVKYNKELLDFLDIDENKLPKLVEGGSEIDEIKGDFISRTGLNTGIILYCGVHDQFAASLGSNYFGDNDLIVSTGTTWVLFARNKNKIDGFFYCRKHPIGGYGYFNSAISSGTVISWEKDFFGIDYDELNKQVELSSFDKNLLVYPFIAGSGSYRNDNNLKFSIHNMNFTHGKGDVIKATMEGVSFEINEIIRIYENSGFDIGKIIVTGGATRSEPWMKILSNVLGRDLYLSEQVDGCCLGAYSLSKKGLSGQFVKFNFNGKIVKFDKDSNVNYQEKFKLYSEKFN